MDTIFLEGAERGISEDKGEVGIGTQHVIRLNLVAQECEGLVRKCEDKPTEMKKRRRKGEKNCEYVDR